MKRTSLLLAGVASLLPAQLAPLLAEAAPGAELPAFQPPATPLVLTRTLWRSLRDGREIMVRRSYEVQFSRNDRGYRLDGHLIDVAVDAPAALNLLADIERNRPDTGVFPLQLDVHGQIIAQQDRITQADLHHAAVDRARTILAGASMDGESLRRSEQLARSILEGAVGATSWPSDLFSPAARSRSERRELALGGGQRGAIEVILDVRHAGDHGLPQMVERRVSTEVDGSARLSREVWTLAPPGAGI
ncbi:MAG: hypothetical protein RL702_58 [Pseudomonadota bacterium]|nr:hypothetical protein [Novosphingobium sp.]